jgi:phage terminase large subunit-like protein
MGAQDEPLSIVISTQSPTDADLLSTLIDDAAAGDGRETKLFLWKAEKEDDPWDEATWYKANPALGDFCSLEEMRRQAARAKRLPASEGAFRNLNLNQRVAAEDHFISPDVWLRNAGDPDPDAFRSCPVSIGVDLSATQDLTAVVAIASADGVRHIKSWFFIPEEGLVERAQRDRVPYDLWAAQGFLIPVPGRVIDEDFIARFLARPFSEMNIRGIAYDRWQFESLRKAFTRIGIELPFLEDFGQGFKTMSPALKALETDLLAGAMRHGNNPALTMCVANARVVIDDAGNRKLTKRRSTGRIDGAVALAMARGASGAEQPEIDVFAMIA